MARHRNIRSMNYSDEYDGYDDVYGHSVEDDGCISLSEQAFMYNRESSKNQQIAAFIKDEHESNLPENQTDELEICITKLKSVLGNTVTKADMTKALQENDLNVDKALNNLLDGGLSQPKQLEKKDKDDNSLRSKPVKRFNIPKLNSFQVKPSGNESTNFSLKLNTSINSTKKTFSSLGDLSSNHLKNMKIPIAVSFKVKPLVNGFIHDRNVIDSPAKDRKVGPSVQENPSDIDLTKALVKNASQKSITGLTKKFDYLSVDCQKELAEDFNCTMDISFVLETKCELSKQVSMFGKILCRRYKRFVPVIVNNKQSYRFSFDIRSPDDSISSYLKT